MSWMLLRAFRTALLLHPPRVRGPYGGEMEASFRQALEDRRGWERVRYGARAVLDVAWSGLAERWRRQRETMTGRERGGEMGDLVRDLRMALRGLMRTPGFTVSAVVVLALGVGANATVFSAIRTALLAPPPFPDPDRLVLLDLADSSRVEPGPRRASLWSYPKLRLLLEDPSFPVEEMGGYATRLVTLTSGGPASRIQAEVVTPGYLEALELRPALGRSLLPDDDGEEAASVVLLAHSLWQDRFGGDEGVVGGTVRLNGEAVTVVGVAPPGFRGLSGAARAWLPVHTAGRVISPVMVRASRAHWMRALGRLPEGVSVEEVDQRLRATAAAVDEAYPSDDPTVVRTGLATPLAEARMNPRARSSLLLLGTAAGFLLLVACANLAGLLLARGEARARETAVRLSLGSGRWRILRASLAEGVTLALLGAGAALFLAVHGAELLARWWPERFVDGSWNVRFVTPELIGVDASVLLFAVAVALLAGLAFGAVSGAAHLRPDHLALLRTGGTVDRAGQRTRKSLVTMEVALALVLVVGAGLLLRSLHRLQAVEPGFSARNVVLFHAPGLAEGREDGPAFTEAVLARLEALPGVEEATAGCAVPAATQCWIGGVRAAGGRSWGPGEMPRAGLHAVEHGYFSTLGIPVLEGRTFQDSDRAGSSPVAVLNRSAARRLFPDGGALGSSVSVTASLTPEAGPGATVVGIVGDVRYGRPEDGFMPEIYLSHRQEDGGARIILRTRDEPLAVVPGARAVLAEMAPDVPLVDVQDLQAIEAAGTAETRAVGGLLGAFALLTLLLAATGVWAVVAWAVHRRTRELGLRMALGASRGAVVGLAFREGLAPVAVGLALGGVGAWAGTRVLQSLLFEVGTTDPLAWAGGALVLAGVGALAAWVPARRATRVDPMEALRAE